MSFLDYDSLRPYRVGYVLGIHLALARLESFRTEAAPDSEMVLRRRATGRTGVAVDLESSLCLAKRMGLDNIHVIKPALEVQYYQAYLHRRHAALAVRLEAGGRTQKDA
ncbi:MAG: hypothetical protein V4724_16325 [Pseudomonadota bacterium]